MSATSDEIKRRIKQIEQETEALQKRSGNPPEGRLRVSKNNEKVRLYHLTEKGDVTGKYLKHSEIGLAQSLAQKDYNNRTMQMLEKERDLLDNAMKFYNGEKSTVPKFDNADHFFYGPEELLWRQLSEERQKLVQPLMEDDAAFVERWLSETYERPGFGQKDPDFYTEAGIRVRSKSEIQIGNKLDWRHLPHYIEKPVDLKGFHVVYPDFTILNVRTRKTYIWEHFGKMSDPEYVADNMEKLYWYGRNGYIPGKNMILTFETSEHSLDSTMIDKIIKTFLI